MVLVPWLTRRPLSRGSVMLLSFETVCSATSLVVWTDSTETGDPTVSDNLEWVVLPAVETELCTTEAVEWFGSPLVCDESYKGSWIV